MNASELDEVRRMLESVAADMDGATRVADVRFDFYTQSVAATFATSTQKVTMSFPAERLEELRSGRSFARKHLAKDIAAAFQVNGGRP